MSIGQLMHMLQPNEPVTVSVAPQTFVLAIAPYRMVNETDAEWVVAAVSGWDEPVDMSPFCQDHSNCTEYMVKAVVFHLHPPDGPADLRCGHYIAYFRHGHRWHLADDSRVDPVLMSGLRGLPYIVVMERADGMEEHVVAIPDGEEPSEMSVEIPSAPISGSATGLASDSGTGSDTDNEPGPQ